MPRNKRHEIISTQVQTLFGLLPSRPSTTLNAHRIHLGFETKIYSLIKQHEKYMYLREREIHILAFVVVFLIILDNSLGSTESPCRHPKFFF